MSNLHSYTRVFGNKFSELNVEKIIDVLVHGELIDNYLEQEFKDIPKARVRLLPYVVIVTAQNS